MRNHRGNGAISSRNKANEDVLEYACADKRKTALPVSSAA
jgi:hypothetical protein